MRLIALAFVLIVLSACQNSDDSTGNSSQVGEDLNQQVVMDEALQDEFRAQFTYQKVINTFGNVPPFSNIVQAEAQHVSEIQSLYQVRGLEPPESDWSLDNVPSSNSLQAACAAGVVSETSTVQMYDQLLARDLDGDIRAVFERQREVSQNQHLPAFQNCQ